MRDVCYAVIAVPKTCPPTAASSSACMKGQSEESGLCSPEQSVGTNPAALASQQEKGSLRYCGNDALTCWLHGGFKHYPPTS